MKLTTMVSIISFLTVSSVFASSFDERDRHDHFEMIREMRERKNIKKNEIKPVSMEGRVICANDSHEKSGRCDLELISSSGDKYDIELNKKLSERHCENHKDLIVKLTAMEGAKFLFWGGDLTVKDFAVLKEVAPLKKKEKQDHRFERFEGFGIGVSI